MFPIKTNVTPQVKDNFGFWVLTVNFVLFSDFLWDYQIVVDDDQYVWVLEPKLFFQNLITIVLSGFDQNVF